MVKKGDIQQFACRIDKLCHPDIFGAGRGIATWVAVTHDKRWTIMADSLHEQFCCSNMNGVDRAFVHQHIMGYPIFLVEQENIQLLLLKLLKRDEDLVHEIIDGV